MRWWVVPMCVVSALVLATAGFLVGRMTESKKRVATQANSRQSGFAELTTQRCPTEKGIPSPSQPLPARTHVAISADAAAGLAAYRDATGTTVVGPTGWECKSSVGADGNHLIAVFPSQGKDPFEHFDTSEEAGTAIALQILPACQGCIAALICPLFPNSEPAKAYAFEECREKPLEEQVTHVSETTVLFYDPPNIRGQGIASGGSAPSFGALSYSQQLGARQVSCTLPPSLSASCVEIVAGTLAGAPV